MSDGSEDPGVTVGAVGADSASAASAASAGALPEEGATPARAGAVFFAPAPRGFLPDARNRSVRLGAALIWLLFIIFPLVDGLSSSENAAHHVLAVVVSAGFVVAYCVLILNWRVRRADRWTLPLFGSLLVFATTLTLVEGSGWGFLFTYCAACAGMLSPQSFGFAGVLACTVLAPATTLIAGGSAAAAIGFGASAAGIGLLLLLMHDLRTRNRELTAARAELARLAVAQERERFARDLHDLLGHTLSVITLKAELAGRLVSTRPQDAAQEMADVEQVARKALAEVREAVSGYRRPTLDGELEGARMALSAAGIEADVHRPAVTLDPDVEAMLAWTVREGATNVIRHSHADHCQVTIRATLADASVEVLDDGVGLGGRRPNGAGAVNGARSAGGGNQIRGGVDSIAGDRGGGASSHGIAGLSERVGLLHGRVEAGERPEGGYRLAVTVPVGPRQ